jgi:hypothetical protein
VGVGFSEGIVDLRVNVALERDVAVGIPFADEFEVLTEPLNRVAEGELFGLERRSVDRRIV